MRVFTGVEELRQAKGTLVGVSDWLTVEQRRIDLFAEATDDHQWIHVDPVRAAEGPFGGTIAHGFLSLSLLAGLTPKVFAVENSRMGVNYGLNKVRFTAPVPVGSRVRLRVELLDVTDVAENAVQVVTGNTLEIEGSERPALVAEWVIRRYF